jgi:heme exporter protein C
MNHHLKILLGASLALMILTLYLIFVYVPTEASMGIVQRIFYFHVPTAWVSFLAYFVVFVASIIYLVRRDSKWDRIASSSAEVGVVFTTLALFAGSTWGRSVWGVWWDWAEPRLTSTLILWFIYVGYLLMRAYVTNKEQAARFGAAIGIIGFLDVPIIILSIILVPRQDLPHPAPLIFEGGLAGSMLLTLMVSIVNFTVLYFLLLSQKTAIKNMEAEVGQLRNIIVHDIGEDETGN